MPTSHTPRDPRRQHAEDRYYKLLETLPLIVYNVEPVPPYTPIYVSRGVEVLGYTREEWLEIPDRWIQSIHPDDRERVLSASERAYANREQLEVEYRLIGRDGQVHWIHDRGGVAYDEDGHALHWRGVMVDVTSRKEAEIALAEREEQYRRAHDALNGALALLEATIESTSEGVLVVDRQGRMVRMNRKFVELWRIPESVLAARDDEQAIAYVLEQLESPDDFLRKVRELYAEPEAESFDTLRFKDGRVYERASRPQRLGDAIIGRVWSFRDVTGRLELESQVRQSQKMEAIGALAGGVAHDFNNILTVIRGHVELLLSDESLKADHRADLEHVYSAAERAMTLTRQLLAFSRKQVMDPVVLDLSAVIGELQPMLRRLIGEDITIDFAADADTRMTADRAQIEQVLLNLVVNARDAMPNGGTISIRAGTVQLDVPRRLHSGATIPTGRFVQLVVSDTGQGMRPETRERVFEPFFTTKKAGHGTGLGLATVYGIVKQSNGFVEVDSRVGHGTCFSLFFPFAAEQALSPHTSELPAIAPGHGTILLVEDEEPVRKLVRRVLERLGYRTLVASGAAEAIEIARARGPQIDLILTDVVMPGKTGTQLVEELRAMQVCPAVVFMTGYTDEDIRRRGVQSAMVLLHKPFTAQELGNAVQKSLRVAAADAAGRRGRA